jgi:hypothetical protein
MALTDFQSSTKVRTLIERSIDKHKASNKLATLLNIYNEGYENFVYNDKFSSVVDFLHRLTESLSCLNFDNASEDDILKLFQQYQETRLSGIMKGDICQAYSMFVLATHPKYTLFDSQRDFMKVLMEKPEVSIMIMPIVSVCIEARGFPEIHVFFYHLDKIDKTSFFQSIHKKLDNWKVYNSKMKSFETIEDFFYYIFGFIEGFENNEHLRRIREITDAHKGQVPPEFAKLFVMEEFYGEILRVAKILLKATREVILEQMPTKIKKISEVSEEKSN